MPVWEELAKFFESFDSLIVGRLEAETNEIDGAMILKYYVAPCRKLSKQQQ